MSVLRDYHPAVSFSFFIAMIVLSLASFQPVFQVLGFAAAVLYASLVSGLRSMVRSYWWLLLLIVIATLANSVFGGRGLTVLFTLDLGFLHTPITAESLVYGVCMGLMLSSVILWFAVLGKVSSTQSSIELFAKLSPTAAMMIARITVFIPELLRQARLVDRAQKSLVKVQDQNSTESNGEQKLQSSDTLPSAADQAEQTSGEKPMRPRVRRSKREQLAYAGALSSHLMEWGMEKSLITANSMVARGYGSRKRSSYQRRRLTRRDLVALLAVLGLALCSFVCVIWAALDYQFYPYLTPLTFWWGYLPFVALCLVPLILQLREEFAWWQSSRTA